MQAVLIKQHNRLLRLRIPNEVKVVYVWGKGLALFAQKKFKKGEKVIGLKGKLVAASTSTPEAIQVTGTKFLDTKYLVPEDFINHSCSPNTRLDLVKREFTAIKNILPNEEITFNYLTTEWDMKRWDTDFQCACGSPNCLGHIKGFRYLTHRQKANLKPLLSPFLLSKL
ncbi:SET domain-containing protein [Candidatus Woesearchaeota archaeon]|nr:SET domain-containing protein [Candidatus Woesearchaeota archaeon]